MVLVASRRGGRLEGKAHGGGLAIEWTEGLGGRWRNNGVGVVE